MFCRFKNKEGTGLASLGFLHFRTRDLNSDTFSLPAPHHHPTATFYLFIELITGCYTGLL